MADAIITDVVQEVSRILTASDVVVDTLEILIGDDGTTKEDGTTDYISLVMTYHQCKADSSEGRLEQPQVDGDVKREWSLSGGDDLKELVSIVLESTNVKAIRVLRYRRVDTHDVIEQFLQGLCTNHTIVSAWFQLICPKNTTIDVLDKSADMLCHNIGLQDFTLVVHGTQGTTKHSGFGNALKMNHTLTSLAFYFYDSSIKLDLEELVRPLIMDENGHQANSTLTSLSVMELSAMSSVGATFARMLRKNSSIKHLDLSWSLTSESDVQELIRSLVENHSLETLGLFGCHGVKGSVFPAIMDVLLVNFTLKDIKLGGTPLDHEGKGLAINEQLRKNEMYKKLHLKELEMAKPTSARVIFCGSPYAGTS
jgi:hypothetical protein